MLSNMIQLTVISVRYVFDRDNFALDWEHSASNLEGRISFEAAFYIWVGSITTGLLHNGWFDIGKAIDSDVLMLVSVCIGVLKEIVS